MRSLLKGDGVRSRRLGGGHRRGVACSPVRGFVRKPSLLRSVDRALSVAQGFVHKPACRRYPQDMDPLRTTAQLPLHLQIADDLRLQIERGELAPGDSLPTLHDLTAKWRCSQTAARQAIAVLKSQGLITGGRGQAPTVRIPPRRIRRSSERHQLEKDLVLKSEADRKKVGAAELDMGVSIESLDGSAKYDEIEASDDLATLFNIEQRAPILRRAFTVNDHDSGFRVASSVSYIPVDLIAENPALLDDKNEPWPGGTMHQLSTVGIEVMSVIDEVSAEMPSTAVAQLWGLQEGIPMLRVRRMSFDAKENLVEVSDAQYPADRTQLVHVSRLRKW